MEHAIRFVDDDALPAGYDFVFVGLPDGGGLIFYRRSALSPGSLEGSWAAYRALCETPPPILLQVV
jgi:hypothetical protein